MHGITDDQNYVDIANAIREKNGSEQQYLPSEMADAIGVLAVGELDLVKYGASEECSSIINNYIENRLISTQTKLSQINTNTNNFRNIFRGDTDILFIDNIDFSNGVYFEDAFNGSKIIYARIPNLPRKGIILAQTFINCSDLIYVEIDSHNATSLFALFRSCSALKKVDINTDNATAMHQLCYNCPLLEEVYLTNVDKNTNFGAMFDNGTINVVTLKFSKWKQANIALGGLQKLIPQSINYIIEHALGEEDGVTARTLTLHATAKANWMDTTQNPDYDYYQAMATEKLITIA